ncbi:hypothetical protein ACP70R_002205 [Stipagrostis hirtigluma subsp. patula]
MSMLERQKLLGWPILKSMHLFIKIGNFNILGDAHLTIETKHFILLGLLSRPKGISPDETKSARFEEAEHFNKSQVLCVENHFPRTEDNASAKLKKDS